MPKDTSEIRKRLQRKNVPLSCPICDVGQVLLSEFCRQNILGGSVFSEIYLSFCMSKIIWNHW